MCTRSGSRSTGTGTGLELEPPTQPPPPTPPPPPSQVPSHSAQVEADHQPESETHPPSSDLSSLQSHSSSQSDSDSNSDSDSDSDSDSHPIMSPTAVSPSLHSFQLQLNQQLNQHSNHSIQHSRRLPIHNHNHNHNHHIPSTALSPQPSSSALSSIPSHSHSLSPSISPPRSSSLSLPHPLHPPHPLSNHHSLHPPLPIPRRSRQPLNAAVTLLDTPPSPATLSSRLSAISNRPIPSHLSLNRPSSLPNNQLPSISSLINSPTPHPHPFGLPDSKNDALPPDENILFQGSPTSILAPISPAHSHSLPLSAGSRKTLSDDPFAHQVIHPDPGSRCFKQPPHLHSDPYQIPQPSNASAPSKPSLIVPPRHPPLATSKPVPPQRHSPTKESPIKSDSLVPGRKRSSTDSSQQANSALVTDQLPEALLPKKQKQTRKSSATKDKTRKQPAKTAQTTRVPRSKPIAHANAALETLPTFQDLCAADGRLPDHLVIQPQTKNCTTLPASLRRYRCAPCISKAVGFVCAFRCIRMWISRRDAPDVFVGGPLFSPVNESPMQLSYRSPVFPTEFNRPPTLADLQEMRCLLARILLPAIEREMAWLEDESVRFIGRRIDLVTKCDYCAATLIGAAWLCTQCGAEACVRCFELMGDEWREAGRAGPEKAPRKMHSDWLKRLQSCTKWHGSVHSPPTHLKIAHITLDELQSLHNQMLPLVKDHAHLPLSTGPEMSGVPPDLRRFLHQPEGDESEPYIKISVVELEADPAIFERLWSAGQAIVVSGMQDRLKLPWTPAYFTAKHADDPCQMLDSNKSYRPATATTVGQFFEQFEKEPSDDQVVWKLRDWPPEVDFQNKFPELFRDFQQAIPVSDVTRRNGIRNVAAHFPRNANVPDIGPKMYIAMQNSDQAGSHGSTVLHMDVADAINIQTYARAGKEEGCALWHLYHSRDTERLREFLYEHHAKKFDVSIEDAKTKYDDPIHTTRTYIDADMRKTLREGYGVKGWEIRQKPGEAVFIPAYTAHQVCNLSNCIKVAADFVSPQSIERCIKLTEEFRVQNHEHRKPWREDLLQINQMLLYAFESTGRLFKSMNPSNGAELAEGNELSEEGEVGEDEEELEEEEDGHEAGKMIEEEMLVDQYEAVDKLDKPHQQPHQHQR